MKTEIRQKSDLTNAQRCSLGDLKNLTWFHDMWNPVTTILYLPETKKYMVFFESEYNDARIICKCNIQLKPIKITEVKISDFS